MSVHIMNCSLSLSLPLIFLCWALSLVHFAQFVCPSVISIIIFSTLHSAFTFTLHAVLDSARKLLIISTINVKCSTGGRCGNGRGKLLSLLLFYGNFSHAYLRITLLPRLNAKLHFHFFPGSSSENVFPRFSQPQPTVHTNCGCCFSFFGMIIYAHFACFKAIVKVFCAHCGTVENYKCFVI